MREILQTARKLWCLSLHSDVMWPFCGSYRCGVCGREYPVCFEDPQRERGAVRVAITGACAGASHG